MPSIIDIIGREILDSRGNPTVAVKVVLEGGVVGVASVPSGASTGIHEALELRDGDQTRFFGAGVKRAVHNVNEQIRPILLGLSAHDQRDLDRRMIELDGTDNKNQLGANAILGVSLALARAAANFYGLPLFAYLKMLFGQHRDVKFPIPMMNLLNGGRHADFALDLQECMVLPCQSTFRERVRAGSEIFHKLGEILKEHKYAQTVGDEGGYAPSLRSNSAAFELLTSAIASAGYEPGVEVLLGTDVAASEFYNAEQKKYFLKKDRSAMTAAQLMAMYEEWSKEFPIVSIEDGLAEDDWDNWELLTTKLGSRLTLVGDDLFVTNPKRLRDGISRGVANAILIKVNQIGTLSETFDAIKLAQENNYKVAVSHRSGETADTFIADLAVAVGADFIKTGSLSRSERVEKYNRLMEIEETLV